MKGISRRRGEARPAPERRLFSHPDSPEVLYTDFDVKAYSQHARGRISIDRDAVAAEPFDEVTAADLAFLWRLDSASLSETRAMLSTWTANEARITAFIATWSFERMWIGYAVKELLEALGRIPEPQDGMSPFARLRSLWVERVMPLVAPGVTAVIGEPTTAGHMIRMALQERAMQSAYSALLPRLRGEARRVVEIVVERRDAMIDYFHGEASARIARSRPEALSARLALLGWRPLRVVGVADPDEPRALGNIFLTGAARQDYTSGQRRTTDLLRGIGLRPGTDRDGGTPPPPSRGLLARRK